MMLKHVHAKEEIQIDRHPSYLLKEEGNKAVYTHRRSLRINTF